MGRYVATCCASLSCHASPGCMFSLWQQLMPGPTTACKSLLGLLRLLLRSLCSWAPRRWPCWTS